MRRQQPGEKTPAGALICDGQYNPMQGYLSRALGWSEQIVLVLRRLDFASDKTAKHFSKSYIEQDFGELSRVAVLVLERISRLQDGLIARDSVSPPFESTNCLESGQNRRGRR